MPNCSVSLWAEGRVRAPRGVEQPRAHDLGQLRGVGAGRAVGPGRGSGCWRRSIPRLSTAPGGSRPADLAVHLLPGSGVPVSGAHRLQLVSDLGLPGADHQARLLSRMRRRALTVLWRLRGPALFLVAPAMGTALGARRVRPAGRPCLDRRRDGGPACSCSASRRAGSDASSQPATGQRTRGRAEPRVSSNAGCAARLVPFARPFSWRRGRACSRPSR